MVNNPHLAETPKDCFSSITECHSRCSFPQLREAFPSENPKHFSAEATPICVPQSLPFQSPQLHPVDPNTGYKVTSDTPTPATITIGDISLPTGEVPALDISTFRAATAVVYTQSTDLSQAKVIVFAHGFSQRPKNYLSLLSLLASQGYTVIAPRTWLFDVAWPWSHVETLHWYSSASAKLRTAVLIDDARSVDVAKAGGAKEIHVMGHSMGGAMGLVLVGKESFDSVALMAPAVGPTVLTPLNQDVDLNAKDGVERMRGLAKKIEDIAMFILHGSKDHIVPQKNIDTMFETIQRAGLSLFGKIEGGTHVWFEDKLDDDWKPLDVLERILFKIIDTIIYGLDKQNEKQLETAKALLTVWFEKYVSVDVVKDIEAVKGEETVDYRFTGNAGAAVGVGDNDITMESSVDMVNIEGVTKPQA